MEPLNGASDVGAVETTDDTIIATHTPLVRASRRAGVLWITLDNPGRRNAITADMFAALGRLANHANDDAAVRVVVIHGAGEHGFASGADISQLDSGELRAPQAAPHARTGTDTEEIGAQAPSLATIDKPVIAMIHGYCLGAGLVLALESDIRIASSDATFCVPAANLGIAYPIGATRRLHALVGPGVAADMLFSARTISATEADRVGLVEKVTTNRTELQTEVEALSRAIATRAPLAHRAHKAMLRWFESPTQERRDEMELASRRAWTSEDFAEGRRAFLERRSADFQGR